VAFARDFGKGGADTRRPTPFGDEQFCNFARRRCGDGLIHHETSAIQH
jgi:hypothetical protein